MSKLENYWHVLKEKAVRAMDNPVKPKIMGGLSAYALNMGPGGDEWYQ